MISFMPSREVALMIGSWSIRWYGIMYVVGVLLTLWLVPRLQKWRGLHLEFGQWIELITWGAVGMLVGGRLGYVLFYEPLFFIQHPLEIMMLWHGGMSSHGGFIGVGIVLWLACKSLKIDFWRVVDVLVVPIAIGLALGRVSNFINQELYGTATTLPWGIAIPGVEGLKHPVQIYEAIADVLLALVGLMNLRKSVVIPGRNLALFLMLYGIIRFVLEFYRFQDWPMWYGLSRGQWLTIPLFLAGAWLWLSRKNSDIQTLGV